MVAALVVALVLLGSSVAYSLTTAWVDSSDGTRYLTWSLSWLAYQAGCLLVLSEAPLSPEVYLIARIACWVWIIIHICILISNIGGDKPDVRNLGI